MIPSQSRTTADWSQGQTQRGLDVLVEGLSLSRGILSISPVTKMDLDQKVSQKDLPLNSESKVLQTLE